MHSAYRREELMIYESVSVAHLSCGNHFFARLPQGKIQPSVPCMRRRHKSNLRLERFRVTI